MLDRLLHTGTCSSVVRKLANQTGRAGAIGTAGASSTLMLSACGHTLPLADIRCGSHSGFIVYHLCAQQFNVIY